MHQNRPHRVIRVFLAVFLITFFGAGLALFVNLFIPFLNEGAFALIALLVMAEFLVMFIVGKSIQVVSALRSSHVSQEGDGEEKRE
jgi:hypothetical protein